MKRDIARVLEEVVTPEVILVITTILVGVLIYADRSQYANIGENSLNEKVFLIIKAIMFVLLISVSIQVLFFR